MNINVLHVIHGLTRSPLETKQNLADKVSKVQVIINNYLHDKNQKIILTKKSIVGDD